MTTDLYTISAVVVPSSVETIGFYVCARHLIREQLIDEEEIQSNSTIKPETKERLLNGIRLYNNQLVIRALSDNNTYYQARRLFLNWNALPPVVNGQDIMKYLKTRKDKVYKCVINNPHHTPVEVI